VAPRSPDTDTPACESSHPESPAPAKPAPPPALATLRLSLEPTRLPELRRHRLLRELTEGRSGSRRLQRALFDTPSLELFKSGVLLEIRRVGRRFVQRLVRSESGASPLEIPVPRLEPEPERIPEPELRELVARAASLEAFTRVAEVELVRSRRTLRREGTVISFDLDAGEVRTLRGLAPICELTLRLEHGERSELFEIAASLQESLPLRIATRSPLERGVELLTGVHPSPQRAGRVRTGPEATLEAVIEASLASAFEQILANEEPARRGVDPEGVHQMRVGVRRLRSALSLFGAFLPAERSGPLREELRWLAGELGRARDLDVFTEETLLPLRRMRPDDPHLKRLTNESEAMRADAQALVREALDGDRYAKLTFRAGRFVYGREWRDQPLTPVSARIFQPASTVARELLKRRYQKVRRHGRGPALAREADRHALRIQLKKLRYASEFLRGLFPGHGARRFLRRIRALQDRLGHLNDAAAARELLGAALQRVRRSTDPNLVAAAGFVEGWSARGAEQILEDLEPDWRSFARRRPFWKSRV